MFERFTQEARALVALASDHARRLGHRYVGGEAVALHDSHIGVEHITLALTTIKQGLVPTILSEAGAPAPALRAAILDRTGGRADRLPGYRDGWRNRLVRRPTAAAVAGCASSRHQTSRTGTGGASRSGR